MYIPILKEVFPRTFCTEMVDCPVYDTPVKNPNDWQVDYDGVKEGKDDGFYLPIVGYVSVIYRSYTRDSLWSSDHIGTRGDYILFYGSEEPTETTEESTNWRTFAIQNIASHYNIPLQKKWDAKEIEITPTEKGLNVEFQVPDTEYGTGGRWSLVYETDIRSFLLLATEDISTDYYFPYLLRLAEYLIDTEEVSITKTKRRQMASLLRNRASKLDIVSLIFEIYINDLKDRKRWMK